ncbi:uncharacterized protein LOC144089706 isoform X1 [Stigmatopora argus]
MAEGGEEIDLFADLLSKPFSRRTFQEKLDIIKKASRCSSSCVARTLTPLSLQERRLSQIKFSLFSIKMQLFLHAQNTHTLKVTGERTLGQIKAHVQTLHFGECWQASGRRGRGQSSNSRRQTPKWLMNQEATRVCSAEQLKSDALPEKA